MAHLPLPMPNPQDQDFPNKRHLYIQPSSFAHDSPTTLVDLLHAGAISRSEEESSTVSAMQLDDLTPAKIRKVSKARDVNWDRVLMELVVEHLFAHPETAKETFDKTKAVF